MESLAAVFGKRLRAIRKARGLTQEQLGRAAKVDFKHVGSIERGVHPPSFAAVERFAKILKVPYYELFTPDQFAGAELAKQIDALMPDAHKLNSEGVRQFLDDLSAAVRKLQLHRRS